jgi:uncharacterized protein (TIGR02300 family)
MGRGCCSGNGGFQLCVAVHCRSLSPIAAAASRSTQHLRALLLLRLTEDGERSGGHAAFWRDWLRPAVRISLLTEPPRSANGAALNRVREDREAVTKPELGTKRLCAHCSAKFYDLNQAPITCPKCGVVFEGVQGRSRSRTEARAPLREVAPLVPETHEAEFVSLEDAEAEAEGKKEPSEAVEAGDEVELNDERGDEEEFVEDSEEESTDVADILGGDIQKEEET